MLERLINFINTVYFPVAISLILLFFSFFLWLSYRRLIAPFNQQISSILTQIEEISCSHDNSLFFQQLENIVTQHSLFTHTWYLFIHRLGHSQQDNFEVNKSLNLHRLLSSQINIRFYQSLPGMFIQTGLFFTFIGLLAALYAAGTGLLSDDLNVVRDSLQMLLIAATFKFSTSLAGIFSAIVFAWREKSHWYRMQNKLNDFTEYLESYLYSYLQQDINLKQSKEKQDVQQESSNNRHNSHTDDELQKIAELASKSLENTIEAQSLTLKN
ncbi:MAG: hypothetical protein HQL46_16195, partial [Gammaproteobacteria bacterium]|nr:hypothetical protein [Gammaproteobacteria bacterium]